MGGCLRWSACCDQKMHRNIFVVHPLLLQVHPRSCSVLSQTQVFSLFLLPTAVARKSGGGVVGSIGAQELSEWERQRDSYRASTMAAPNGVHQAGGRGGAAAALYAAGRPPAGGLSPLSESLWKARAESTSVGVPSPHDFAARLTWIDLWVTVTGKGSKQAILQGLTGTTKPFISKLAAAVCLSVCICVHASASWVFPVVSAIHFFFQQNQEADAWTGRQVVLSVCQ